MTNDTTVNSADETQSQSKSRQEAYIHPAVDIYEDAEGITIKADLPGVSRDRLDVQVEGNTLTIGGQASIAMPEGMAALYADMKATHYHRSFTLSHELETDKVSAEMKNGALTLRLPKRAELQPRKIEISGG